MASVLYRVPTTQNSSITLFLPVLTRSELSDTRRRWASLQRQLKCHGRVSCLFSDGRREEEARKALEGALGGKKSEFEKWNKEIKRREENSSGGGNSGGGGWFGWFRWSNDDNFWQEAQQASLALLGIIVLYLIAAKGDLLVAVVFNPLLYGLRSTRSVFAILKDIVSGKTLQVSNFNSEIKSNEVFARDSAKERVMKKWGRD